FVGLGAVWAVGAMGWLGMKFTMLHVALVPLLFGLGIDYSIHMLNRYSEERRDRVPPKEAVKKSIQTTGIAVILAAVTTMIGFGSFLVSDLSAMSSMGVFTALGIGFIFLLSVVFLPSALLLRDRGEGKIRRVTARRGKHAALVLSAVAGFAERHKKPIILLATALAALSLLSASSIQTAMSFETFLPEDVPAMRTMREISEQFGGQWTIVVLARGEIRSPGGLQEMVELENSVLREKENLITGSRSLGSTVSLIAGAQPSELSQAQIDAIINNEKILEPSQRKRLLSDNLAVIYFYMNPRNDKEMAEAIQAVKSCIQERSWNFIDMRIDGEPAVGGEAVIITEVIGRILSSTIQTTFFAIILCLAVVASAFRSLTLGLAALTPLLLTVSWEFGMLKILGWPLDVLTMGISALTIGVGIDYGIHIIHRFLEENKRKDVEFSLALETTVTHVGMSLLAAWATTIGVFGILALSRMPAMARFGGLTALVITLSFVSALVVLPSVLALTMRKSFTKRGF
ncbi:MAG: MMPL family transporter, partial [Candidatus Hadarchaeales archaeon]